MVSGDSSGGRVLGRRWRDLWRVVRGPVGSKTRGAEGGWGRRREPRRREGAGQRRARVSALRCVAAPTAQLIWGPGADEDVEGQRARVRSGCCTKKGFDVKNGQRLTWHGCHRRDPGRPPERRRAGSELRSRRGPRRLGARRRGSVWDVDGQSARGSSCRAGPNIWLSAAGPTGATDRRAPHFSFPWRASWAASLAASRPSTQKSGVPGLEQTARGNWSDDGPF